MTTPTTSGNESVTDDSGILAQPVSSTNAVRKNPGIRKAVIVGGNRIPFARSGGAYAHCSNQDMLTAAPGWSGCPVRPRG